MIHSICDIYGRTTKSDLKRALKPAWPKPKTRINIPINDTKRPLANIQVNEYEHCAVSATQKDLLIDCASLEFHFGGYTSLAEILNDLGIKVVIEPGIVERDLTSFIEKAKKFWEKKRKDPFAEKIAGMLKQYPTKSRLRGCYLPESKTIKLYPDEMETEYDGKCVEELLVTTLAHETMHAYFDRPGYDTYPYVHFVEEPLAEFGMLIFMHEAIRTYEYWAEKDVENKHNCYRWGATLLKRYLHGETVLRKLLEDYKWIVGEYDILTNILPSKIPTTCYCHSCCFTTSIKTVSTKDLRTLIKIPKDIAVKMGLSKGDACVMFFDSGRKFLFAGDASIYYDDKNMYRLFLPQNIRTRFIAKYGTSSTKDFKVSIVNNKNFEIYEL